MARPLADRLSRREKQIMDILFRLGRASATEVQAAMPDAPSLSAVRAQLRVLEDKGHVRHQVDGPRYLFLPRASRETERRRALSHLVHTFFNGSYEALVATLLGSKDAPLDAAEIERLSALIERARREES